ncbi:very-long-chain aldehyde decarbonylase GL1-5-like [Aristolochia californica]|uniref:very-long-chain aldehyde decarbonylase GL1-5-like n=1 Tax=Aristolochia californica TaxID=171875 RepID=UPI0035DD89AB
MATKPGLFTSWPWQMLGTFKYVVLAPWVASGIYSWVTKPEEERDLTNFLFLPILLWRWAHNQIWISLSRFQTARSKHKIVDKGIEFEQVDREENWDDQILLNGLVFYTFNQYVSGASHLPMWRTDGMILTILLHIGPVEFLYYWLHRALHHHYLYSRYHSHHHSSVVTEPITSVIHPFAEIVSYYILFSIPQLAMLFTGTNSHLALIIYLTYIDFMNNMGHCNFELVPNWVFKFFPPLKYLMYTPSFHSLHHTQFRTNYSLFMPLYDYLYGTVDKTVDSLYNNSLKGNKEIPQVVHLTHPTSVESIYHLRLGLASLASKPYSSKWYLSMIQPLTCLSVIFTWIFGSTFTVESIKLDKLKMETWAIPRFSFHYYLSWHRDSINNMIEKAILEADREGVKVMSLGLLNQSEELNENGKLYLQKHPKLKVRLVDGTALVAAVVLNGIPQDTNKVIMRGELSKACHAIVLGLCQKAIKVSTVCKSEHQQLKRQLPAKFWSNLVLSDNYDAKVWLVGNGLNDKEQEKAPKGASFIPFSQFPVKNLRKDCFYQTNPAMRVPKNLENMHACENWLPRRVMSACRVAGIVHALEGWDTHECGEEQLLNADKVWNAALQHGFRPL